MYNEIFIYNYLPHSPTIECTQYIIALNSIKEIKNL